MLPTRSVAVTVITPAFLPIGVGVAVLRFETAHDAMPEPASAHAKKPKFAV